MTQHQNTNGHLASRKVLVIQPDVRAPLGRFSQWLAQFGAEVTVVQPFRGDQIPSEVTADGLIILGGTMSYHHVEEFPWLEDIAALCRRATAANIPTLGICLGAQLLAAAFDGEVTVNSPTGPETGVVDIEWTEAALHDPLVGDLSPGLRATAFHYDGITALPEHAVLLGRGERYPNQVFRIGSAVGVQFHPEASPELFNSWCASDVAKKPELAEFFAEQKQHVAEADDEIMPQVQKLAHNFVQQLHPAPQAQPR